MLFRRLPARTAAVFAAGALALTACGSSGTTGGGGTSAPGAGGSQSGSASGGANEASAPGVTATTVTIGSHQPLTGPAAPGYSEIAPASEAMFKYINDQGGINGRTIKYVYKDDGYNPTRTVDVVRQLVQQDKVFAIFNGLGTPTHSKVLDFLNQQKVPDLFVASGATLWNQPQKYPYTFGWQVDYVTEGKILGKYVKENFAGKKIGYFFQNDDFGMDGVKGLDTQIPADQVVARQSYVTSDLAQPNGIAPQMSALKNAGVEVLVMFTIPAATAVAKLTALQLGFNPQLVVTNVGSDPTTLNGLLTKFSQGKANASVLDGLVTDGYFAPYTGDNPWAQLFEKVRAKYLPNQAMDGNVAFGMAVAYTFAQALKLAGQNPTRDSIVKAVESGDLSPAPGLTPFRYSNDNHGGYSGAQIIIIKNGTLTLEGMPETTDVEGGPIVNYTKSVPPPGANGVLTP